MKTENNYKYKNRNKIKHKNKKYLKAESLFPKDLLAEIQKYAQGELIYIPKPKESREKWGYYTGSRNVIEERNTEICRHFQNGMTIGNLAAKYFLSVESIKRIVYKSKT
ncbi:MAG: CD3324 family protein [Oscillospiraceae bacterium]|nr:CD3324 family protein [Oscillospiraceae bacterium]